MTRIDREAPGASTAFLALGCVGFVTSALLPLSAMAEEATAAAVTADEGAAARLRGVVVTGTAIEDGPKVERPASPKYTRPLLDTPQTITVISAQTIRQQNLLTLRDALSTLPGITFGAGEGGGGYGDSINLRGYTANNDITQDGVRDSAQYSRTDPFNLQQVEVVNGANSVYGGSGSIGGTINLVTKTPMTDDLTVLQAGVGTDNYYRASADSNVRVSDLVAVRLNAVYHENDVPGREVERYERWGIAPSVTIGIDSPTRLTLSYLHQEDDNTPLFGVPYFPAAGGKPDEIDRSDYFGIANLDRQKITVDQLTARFEHEVSDAVSIRNLTRWQRVEQRSRTSAPQGVFCLSTGLTPLGVACAAPGLYTPSGPRGYVRDQENQLLYTQLDLRAVFDTGGLEHTLVIGGSFTEEDYTLGVGNLLRNADGSAVAEAPISIADPVTTYTGPINFIRSGRSQGHSRNAAVYLFDTIKLSDQFELNGGIRYENNKASFRADSFSTASATLGDYTRGQTQRSDQSLFSYRIGAVFKPVPNASLYVAYGNSRNPTSISVRAGCGLPVTGGGGVINNPCDVSPEEAVNYEIGGKVDLLNAQLQLTAALFRNERKNYRVNSNDPSLGLTLPVNDGRARVDGLALGASGRITPAWTIFANYTWLDSKVKQSISDFQKADGVVDLQAGNPLNNTPKHSGSLFTTYTLPFGLQLGYGLTYQGSFVIQNNVAGALPRSEDWLTHRLLLSYPVTDRLTAQLNVQNVTNEKYYTSIRNTAGGWATPGEARSAVLSLFYSF